MKKTQLAGDRQIRLYEDAGKTDKFAGKDALSPPKIRILVVTDGHASSFHNASFSPSPYGLSTLMDCMAGHGEYFVEFQVTGAHRQADPIGLDPEEESRSGGAHVHHYENFRFDQPDFDLFEFDEVWLFGIRAGLGDPHGLSDSELEVIERWMDSGGGIFATGGPDELGSALAGRIPRVRSMRRWGPVARSDSNIFYLDAGTGNEGSAAHPSEGAASNRGGRSGRVVPKHYPQLSWSPYATVHTPHPVLWSPAGAIEALPVHARQNEVFEEADIDFTAEFDLGTGKHHPEFPSALTGGPRPEVVAWATGAGTTVGPIGAVGVYDGHKVRSPQSAEQIGRIVVDSSWRHWFDSYHEAPSQIGESATGSDRSLADYYCNIALWLAPPAVQRTMLLHAIWGGVTPLAAGRGPQPASNHMAARREDA